MSKQSLKIEILEKVSQLATAGFGLVAALAWNDAIQALFKKFIVGGSELWAKFLYALVVTVIIVLVTIKIGDILNRLKGNQDS